MLLNSKPLYLVFLFMIVCNANQSFAQSRLILNGAIMKMVNTVIVATDDITIASGGSVIVDSATIKIAGDISNAGIFDLKNGSLEMNGTAPQTIPANSITDNVLKNLIVSNNFSLAGEDSVTGTLSFGQDNKMLSTGGFLTIKSTAASTARVADITNAGANSGNTFSGGVHVERYVNAKRAWRLLTAPVLSATQTINAAWQEGQVGTNTIPGYGTHLTGGITANGFDNGVNPYNIGIREYIAGVWTGLTNTNVNLINNQPGYMIFIRGDRSTNLSLGVYAPVSTTVLRSTGQLKINDQSFTVAATGYTVVSNPYASSIDLDQIAKTNSTNIQDNFYLWDYKLTGSNSVGAYVNVSWNGSSYDITPSSGGSGVDQFIQSGSAFLAKSANGTSTGTLIIKETDKSATASRNVNRPANNATGKLRTNLYAINTDGTTPLVDGILNSFDDMYSNKVDNYDAVKIKNFSESLATERDGILLVVERKQLITDADTIFLNMLQMRAKSYKFEFIAENFNTAGLTGILEDSYTNTKTELNLTGTALYGFTVINVPGSWNPHRFRIVFKLQQFVPLPVTFTNIKAFAQNDNIKVEWHVSNEFNIKEYEVETSRDGRHFIKANTVMALANNNVTSNYNWLDENPREGDTYYRIKSVSIDGEVNYTALVKVSYGKARPHIEVLTNFIDNNEIIFQMHNMSRGIYSISISNALGEVMFRKKIKHSGGGSTEKIQLKNTGFAQGIYHLNILRPDLMNFTEKLLLR